MRPPQPLLSLTVAGLTMAVQNGVVMAFSVFYLPLFAGPSVGVIAGWIAVASGPGEAFGAWGGGLVYDLTGGYLGALAVSALALLAGIWTIWRVPAASAGPGATPAKPLGRGPV